MYKILEASNIKDLQNKVNSNLEAGFITVGGMSVTLKGTNYQGTGKEHIFYQSVLFSDTKNKDV